MTPKDFIGNRAYYEEWGQKIFCEDPYGGSQLLLDLRGWGAIQNLFEHEDEAAKFQDELGSWIADAINEKLERS